MLLFIKSSLRLYITVMSGKWSRYTAGPLRARFKDLFTAQFRLDALSKFEEQAGIYL